MLEVNSCKSATFASTCMHVTQYALFICYILNQAIGGMLLLICLLAVVQWLIYIFQPWRSLNVALFAHIL